jgi:aspartokinase
MVIFNVSQINKDKLDVLTNNVKSLYNADVVIEHSLSLTTIIGNSLNKIPKLSNNIISVIDNANLKLSGHSSNGKSFCLLTKNNNIIERVHNLLF